MRLTHRLAAAAGALVLIGATTTACGSSGSDGSSLKLGYFPNLTHATALVGLEQGTFTAALGPDVKFEALSYNAGPDALEALSSGAVDATYIGPSPTITGFTRSEGKSLRVIAGAASGGASLVVKPEITSAAQLKGKKIGTPQLGNTQDVAARYWLKQQGLSTNKDGSGDVSIQPQENAVILSSFTAGTLDGAWVPEPWVERLVKAGGKILVDERTLWPNSSFVTTNLIVRTSFLNDHPDLVQKLVNGSVAANASIAADPERAKQAVSTQIGKLTGKPLDLAVINESWKRLTFTDDPLPATLTEAANHAKDVGLLDEVKLAGLYDLGPLNTALRAGGKPEITSP